MVLTVRLGRGVVGEVVSRPQGATEVPSQIPNKKVDELLVVMFFCKIIGSQMVPKTDFDMED